MKNRLWLLVCVVVVLLAPTRAYAQLGAPQALTANGTVCWDAQPLPSLTITASGSWTGTLTPTATHSLDVAPAAISHAVNDATGSTVASITSNARLAIQNFGYARICVTATSVTGTATVMGSRGFGVTGSSTLTGEVTVGDVGITSIAAGDTNIGNVDVVSSALPTGAATGAKQDTGNTSLSSIDGKLTAVDTGAVVVASSALPSGAATSANQTTLVGAVDGIEALLATIDSDTSRLTSSAEGLAPGTVGATTSLVVAGIYNATPPTFTDGERGAIQFSSAGRVLVELPAGGSGLTDTELRATAVPVSGTITCTNCSGTGVSVNEDVASGDADPGTPAYAVRQTSPANTSGADGDYEALQMAAGRLWVSALIDAALPAGSNVIGGVTQSGTWNVANTGTFAAQAAQAGTWTVQPGNTPNTTPWLTTISEGGNLAAVNASGQLSITCANCSGSGASSSDDSAWTFGTTSGAGAMFVVDDAGTNAVTENSIGAARMSTSRVPYANLTNAAGTLFATLRDTGASDSLNVAIVDAAGDQITTFGGGTQYATGDAEATPSGTVALGFDGSNVRALATNSSGNLQVVFASAQAVTQSGTWNVADISGTISLPTGAATAANQATVIAAVDGLEGVLATIDADTGAILTAVQSSTRTDNYTTTADGSTVDATARALKSWAIQVKGVGAAPTSWTAELQVSLDGTNFVTLLTHNATDGSVDAMSTPFPALYYRTRVTALVLGTATSINVTVVGMP